MKNIYLILFLLSITLPCLAQQLLNGKVQTIDEKPLSGVTIRIKNSSVATVSKTDGSFSIPVKNLDTLVISYIGYLLKNVAVSVPFPAFIKIALQESKTDLKEVTVSTGYYQVPQERATGSFTRIDEKALNTSVSTDILSRLKGITNGISFDERNGGRNVSIRGVSTLFADAHPLIVLNNFPFDGDIKDINPNDVESITVLKDAAAASIWGVRAANGVIVITTKKGNINRPTEFNFNSNLTYAKEPDVFQIPMMASGDFINVEKYLFNNGFYTSAENDPTHPSLTPAVESLIAERDGKISSALLNDQLNAFSKLDVRNDYKKYLYQSSLNQQYALSAKGGSDKSTYYYSFGYDHNTDYLADKYSRLTIRADNTFNVGNRLKINPVISYIKSENDNGRPDFTAILPSQLSKSIYPYAQFADNNGNPLAITTDYRTSFIDDAQAKGLLDWTYKPLPDFNDRKTATKLNDILVGLNADFNFTNKFIAQAQYQYENVNTEFTDLYNKDSYYVRDLVNRYTQDDGSGNLSYPIPYGGILASNNIFQSSQTGRIQLKYTNSWNKNDLAILAGTEVREIHINSNASNAYGYNESGLTTVPVDHVTQFPQYNDNGTLAGIPDYTSFSDLTNRFTSVYANASYTFDNKYIISASGRKDESNLFGVNSNQKGVPLWSTGIAWNISKESFYHFDWLEYLKLRLTYGFNGNLPSNLTAVASLLQTSGGINNQPYAIVKTYPNPDLSWEKVGVINLGIDFSSKNNVIAGSLELYQKKGTGLIGKQPIDPTVGIPAGVITRNVADIINHGIDLQIISRNIDRQFKWQTNLLFSYNRDKITAYQSTAANGSTLISDGISVLPVVGQPAYGIVSYKWAGLDPQTGDPIGMLNRKTSKDYATITSQTPINELDYNGPALPPFFGSISNTFSYKRFSLYVNISYRLGYYFRKSSISYYYLYNNGIGNKDFANRWQKSGDESNTYVPSMPTINDNTYERDAFYSNSSALVGKADNIRLQELNLTYQPVIGKLRFLKLTDLQIYAYAQNLGILWKANKFGIDPDYGQGYIAPSSSISFGIKAKF